MATQDPALLPSVEEPTKSSDPGLHPTTGIYALARLRLEPYLEELAKIGSREYGGMGLQVALTLPLGLEPEGDSLEAELLHVGAGDLPEVNPSTSDEQCAALRGVADRLNGLALLFKLCSKRLRRFARIADAAESRILLDLGAIDKGNLVYEEAAEQGSAPAGARS